LHRALPRLAAREPLEPRIPLATQAAIEMLKRGGSAAMPPSRQRSARFVEPVSSGLGGDCFASSGIPRRASWRAWPAPAARQNHFHSPLSVRARKMASTETWRGHRLNSGGSMAGGRCTSATESSSGRAVRAGHSYCEIGAPVPQILALSQA